MMNPDPQHQYTDLPQPRKQSQSPDSAVTSQLDQSRAHDDDAIACSQISSFTYIVTAAGTSQNNSDIGRALTVCTYIIHI